MGERKVLNKYFPPDFDPSLVPKGERKQDNAMKVRMMLPMTIRCTTCGEFMYKGTKFNCKKEDVVGETYLGMQIFRFYQRCRKCSAEITYLTDPQNLDYRVEHGATRNFEQWKEQQSVEEALKARREAEDEDRVKKLENKTADAKREMDVMDALDDMLHTKGQHTKITPDEAIAAIRDRAAQEARLSGAAGPDYTQEDEEALQKRVQAGYFVKRLEEEDTANPGPLPSAARRLATKPRTASTAVKRVVKRDQPASSKQEDPASSDKRIRLDEGSEANGSTVGAAPATASSAGLALGYQGSSSSDEAATEGV